MVKNLPDNAGVMLSIPGLGRNPGGVNGHLLQDSHLENPKASGAWQGVVHGSQRVGHDWPTEHKHICNFNLSLLN